MSEFRPRGGVSASELYAECDPEFLRPGCSADSAPRDARNVWSKPAHRSEHLDSRYGEAKTPENLRIKELHRPGRCEECLQSSAAGSPGIVFDDRWNCRPEHDEPHESFRGHDH